MEHESVELLSRYIRIDTSNPPGNEAAGAQFFAEIFDEEKIEYKTYEPTPERVSIRATIPGTGEKGPLVLLNHMDVVPAVPEEWSFDPFGGEIKEGFVHGRGALDMKGLGIMELLAFLEIKRKEMTPCRDLIFLAVADEETGGSSGVGYLLENHYDDFRADLVLNEGGFGLTGLIDSGPVMLVSPAEKGVCWIRLTRTGPPGHGSMPHGNNALEKMTHALSKLLANEEPVNIVPIMKEYFKQMGKAWEFLQPFLDDGKSGTLEDILVQSGLLNMPQISAMVRNTISPNMMKAGIKTNVIPSKAEVELDIRLVPGQGVHEFIEQIKNRLGDEAIKIQTIMSTEATESPRDNEYYSHISNILDTSFPGSVIAPSLLVGTSDSRFFRQKGIPAYGVCPALISLEELKTVHGIDEKISVQNMLRGTAVYSEIVKRLCDI